MISPDILLAYLESPNPAERANGLAWIVRYQWHDFLGDALRLLQDEVRMVRVQAAHTLKGLGNPVAIEALIDALIDRERRVRDAAADALVSFDNTVLPHLAPLCADGDPLERAYALRILQHIGSPQAQAMINLFWKLDSDE